jgi:low affinity Fe/Cu permease
MYRYNSEDNIEIEDMDLDLVIIGVSLFDWAHICTVLVGLTVMFNIYIALIVSIVLFIFFFILQKKRMEGQPLELDRKFMSTVRNIPVINNIFLSVGCIFYEEEVYRD